MTIPKWVKCNVDEVGLEKIRKAVTDAEKTTSGEIVPMIVRSSASTGHVFWLLALAFLALFTLLAYNTVDRADQYFVAYEIGALVAAVALAALLSRFDFVRRLCTPDSDRSASVMRRAQLEFYQQDLKKTKGGTGILIFVSLMEHEAVVLADQGIAQHHKPETWNGVIALLLAGIKAKDFAGGMADAVTLCGRHLSEKFPRAQNDQDELPNRLVIQE